MLSVAAGWQTFVSSSRFPAFTCSVCTVGKDATSPPWIKSAGLSAKPGNSFSNVFPRSRKSGWRTKALASPSTTAARLHGQFGWRAPWSWMSPKFSDLTFTSSQATRCGRFSPIKSTGRVRRSVPFSPKSLPGTLPIIVGDDLTDERAFALLPHGLTVRVGKNLRTRARFLLRDPEEVKVFLRKLEVEIV